MTSNNDMGLTKILEDALSGDAVLRNKAEVDITQLADSNFGLFLLNLSMKISNEAVPKPIRQISATIIKNMITNQSYTPKWYALQPTEKSSIKNYILSTLSIPNRSNPCSKTFLTRFIKLNQDAFLASSSSDNILVSL